jgi:hypothetical protein
VIIRAVNHNRLRDGFVDIDDRRIVVPAGAEADIDWPDGRPLRLVYSPDITLIHQPAAVVSGARLSPVHSTVKEPAREHRPRTPLP